MIDNTEMAERRSEETADAEASTSNQRVIRKASGKLAKAPNGKRVKKVHKQRGNGSYLKKTDTQITFAVNGVKYYGISINKAAGRSGIKPGTLRDALRRYRKHGNPLPAKRGCKPKAGFTQEAISFILNQVDENLAATIEDIHAAFIANGTIESPTVSTLQKWLRSNARITFQRFQSFPPMPSEVEDEQYVQQYWSAIDRSDLDVHTNCIFIGEASYVYNLRHIYPEAMAPGKSKSVPTEHN